MKTGKGRDVDNHLVLYDVIGTLARRRFQDAEKWFATLGLNHTEARLLNLVHQEGGDVAQDVLSGMIFIDRTNVGRALKSLEASGYIERRKGESDKRTYMVRITAKGRKIIAEIGKLRKKMAKGFFGDLSADDAGRILRLLEKSVELG